jgi:cell division septation protein DedD
VEKPPVPARVPPSDEPAPGQTYLQLAATSKREADIMVDVLRQKKFKAMAAEIPEKRGTYRVLVGPLADSAVNQMRSDLQGAGFPGNAAIRRTF